MRVTILTMGSRGDLEPFLALGQGLVGAGHRVRLATHGAFEARVRDAGLPFAELPGDPQAALSGPDGLAVLAARNPAALPRRIRRLVGPVLAAAAEPAEEASAGADVVVAATLALVGFTAAERAGAALAWAHLQPAAPTRAYASALAPLVRDLPGPLNLVTWALSQRLFWRGVLPVLAARRRHLGMAPLPPGPPASWAPDRRPLALHGYSAAVAPTPGDWPADVEVTGYWSRGVPPGWEPPAVLARFLAAGPVPVYLGFGSMPDPDPAALAALLLDAVRAAGLRAVVLSGWSGLRPPDSTGQVLVVDEVPHAWLFPRVQAVLHHGGAGTTAAGLRAGAPTVVVPFFADQFFWGRRVAALGAGPAPIPRERLTTARVAAALRTATTDPGLRAGARAVAGRLAGEDGTARAVAVLERLA